MVLYRAKSILSFIGTADDISRRIKFEPCNGGSILLTDDEWTIKAVEDSTYYALGQIVRMPDEEGRAEGETAEDATNANEEATTVGEEVLHTTAAVAAKAVEGIRNFTEAKEYLRKEHGVAASRMKSLTALLAVADELGVSFPDMQ